LNFAKYHVHSCFPLPTPSLPLLFSRIGVAVWHQESETQNWLGSFKSSEMGSLCRYFWLSRSKQTSKIKGYYFFVRWISHSLIIYYFFILSPTWHCIL